MKVKIKKLHKDAVIPSYAKDGDAGMDLVATSRASYDKIEKCGYAEYGTGLSIEIPKGFVGLVFPRSSISKTAFMLANSVGVIDSGYRGEIKLRFNNVDQLLLNYPDFLGYEVGDKIAQLIIMPIPHIEFEEVDELEESERGEGGFGSTDKKS